MFEVLIIIALEILVRFSRGVSGVHAAACWRMAQFSSATVRCLGAQVAQRKQAANGLLVRCANAHRGHQ